MEKSDHAFRTISEVADHLSTPAHVLRFWESRFPQIRPVKRAGGRRYYRPADVALLSGIRRLLHDDGMTIRGVQKILREQGVRHVCALAGTVVPEAEEDWAEAMAIPPAEPVPDALLAADPDGVPPEGAALPKLMRDDPGDGFAAATSGSAPEREATGFDVASAHEPVATAGSGLPSTERDDAADPSPIDAGGGSAPLNAMPGPADPQTTPMARADADTPKEVPRRTSGSIGEPSQAGSGDETRATVLRGTGAPIEPSTDLHGDDETVAPVGPEPDLHGGDETRFEGSPAHWVAADLRALRPRDVGQRGARLRDLAARMTTLRDRMADLARVRRP